MDLLLSVSLSCRRAAALLPALGLLRRARS